MDVQAIPNQTVIRARESTLNTPADRRIKDVSKKIHRLNPDAAPFTLLTSRARSMACSEPQYHWIEEELAAQWSQVNNVGGSALAAPTVIVDHARYFQVGDIFNVVRTGMKCRVTAVDLDTNTLTIVRAIGASVDSAMNDNDDLQIIGNAYAEGSPVGLEQSHIEKYLMNYVQIFRHALGATGTQDATSGGYLGQKDRPRLRAQTAIKHKLQIERSALFGERNIDAVNTNNPRRYTGGAMFYLTDNIKDAGGGLSPIEVWDWLQAVYTHHTGGGNSRVLLASPTVVTAIDMMALTVGNVSINLVPTDKTFGISLRQWNTSHGTFNIIKHPLLDNGLGGQGYGGFGMLLDPSTWQYRYLPGRNTQLRPNVQNPGDDAWTDEYLTECGWEVSLAKTQGILKGVTGAAA